MYHYYIPGIGESQKGYPFFWKYGLIYQKDIFDKNVLRRQDNFSWDKRFFGVATDDFCLIDSAKGQHCGHYFYAPVLTEQKTAINGQGDYSTEFQQNDVYGRPHHIIEQGDNGAERYTDLSYFTNVGKNIIGGIQTKKVAGYTTEINSYNSIAQLLAQTKNGVETHYTYDNQGDLHTLTDANHHTLRFDHYSRGQAQTITYPDGSTKNRVVNPSGTVKSVTDANGHTTTYTYDALNRVKTITDPKKNITEIVYTLRRDAPSLKTLTKNNLQVVTQYDALDRPIEIDKKDLQIGRIKKQVMQYNADNHITFKSYPFDDQADNKALGVYTDYDALGRVTQSSFPQKNNYLTTYQYSNGHQVVITDPKQHITTKTYLSYGNPYDAKLMDIQQPEGIHTHITRDMLGYIQTVTQNNLTRTYTYYPTYFLKSLTDPEVGTTSYTYDNVGNIQTQQIGDQATTFTYDPMNRLLTAEYSDASPGLTKTYYTNGNLKTVDKGNIHEKYQYDPNDNLTDETFTINDKDYQLHYDYDALDHLADMIYPDKQTVTFQPDALGEPTQVNGWVSNITSYPNGIIQSMQLANGVNTHTTLNDRLMPEDRQFTGKSLNIERTYHYDPNSNITSITDSKDPSYNLTLGYDGVNRLTQADGHWGKGVMHYTPNGDIKMMAFGKNTLNYSFNANGNLDHVNKEVLKYDAAGNVINNGKNQFNYGVDGNLTTVKDVSGNTVESFQYDGNGQRLVETNNLTGDTTYSLYNLGGTLLFDTNPTKGTSHDYLYLNGHKIVQLENTGTNTKLTYFHNNLLGSPIAASDVNGKLLWEEHYQPYGERLDKTQGKDNLQWFTGKVEDANDGLMYYGARYYDPRIGRFMGADPKGFDENSPLTFNLYAYANDNPLRYIDPTGMWSFEFSWGGGNWGIGFHTKYGFIGFNQEGFDQIAESFNGFWNTETFGLVGEEHSNPYYYLGLAGSSVAGGLEDGATEYKLYKLFERPSSFRKKTIKEAWDTAEDGKNGGKLCPTCGKEVKIAPGKGKRDWDVDHQPPWSKRTNKGTTRKEVLDNYNAGTRLECPGCNRSRGSKNLNE